MIPSELEAWRGQVFVIKVGGDPLTDVEVLDALLEDLKVLQAADVRLVLVHGGGPQATKLTHALGLKPHIVGGRRITDPDILEVMKMTLAGSVSVNILARCRAAGIAALSVPGVAANLIQAVRRPPRIVSGCGDDPVDFGEVGDIDAIGTELLEHLCSGGYLPVVNSLGCDDKGQVLNINADIAANKIAIAMGASKLLLLTGAPGVLENADDPTTLMADLTISEARNAIAKGIIGGGMIPKLEESFNALEAGVGAVHILGAATPRGVLKELNESKRTGTRLRL